MAQQGRINFGVGFQVDKTGLQQLRQELQSLSNLSFDKFKLNNPQGTLADLQKLQNEARELSSILNQSYNLKLNTINLTQFDKLIKKAGISTAEFAQRCNSAGIDGVLAFRKLTQTLGHVNTEIKQSHKLLDSMAQTLTNTIKWTIASTAVNAFTGSITKAYDYTKKLDQSLNDIRIVTEKNADEMERFAKQANMAARELGATTTDYTRASLIYYQQGLSDKEVAARTAVTTKVANVTGQSASDTSDQLTAIWNGYKVSAQEAELYIDKVSAVAARTGADLEELSEGMGKVASAAKSMGVDIDQLNASLATVITVTREDANAVGTAFKTIYARMGDLVVDGQDEFGTTLGDVSGKLQQMGVEIMDSQGQMREMGDVIEEVASKWGTWTRAQQQAAAVALAGKRQYNNLIALFENWDMYEEAKGTSKDSIGTLQKQNETYLDSIEAHMNKLTAASEKLYDTIFDPEVINTVLDGLTGLVDLVDTFINSIGGMGPTLLMISGLLTSMFSKQLGSALNTTIQNKFAATQEKEQMEAWSKKTEEMRAAQQAAYDDAVAKRKAAQKAWEDATTVEGKTARYQEVENAILIEEAAADTLKINELKDQAAKAGLSQEETDAILADYRKALADKIKAKENEVNKLHELEKQEAENRQKYNDIIKQLDDEESKAREEAEAILFNQGRSRRSGLPYEKDQIQIDYDPNAPTGRGNKFNTQQAADVLRRAESDLVSGKTKIKDASKVLTTKKGFTAENLEAYKAEADALAKKTKELGLSTTAQGDLNKAQKEYRDIMLQAEKEIAANNLSEETRQELLDKSNILTREITKNLDDQIAENKAAQKYFKEDAEKIHENAEKKKKAAKEVADAEKDAIQKTKEALAQETEARETAAQAIGEQIEAAEIKAAQTKKQIELATEGFTQLAGSALSVVSAVQQLSSIDAIWSNEDASATEKFGQTLMVILSASAMLIPALVSINTAMDRMKGNTLVAIKAFFGFSTAETTGIVTTKLYDKVLKGLSNTFKQVKKSASSAGGQIALATIAVMTAIHVIEKLSEHIDNLYKADDTKANAASDAADSLAEAYNNAREAVDELAESITKYEEMQDALDGMVVGTDEWTDALEDANREVLELVKQYKILADYVDNDNGRLTISQEGFNVLQDQLDAEEDRAYIAANAAQISARNAGQQQKSEEALKLAQSRYVDKTMQWSQDVQNVASLGTVVAGGTAGGIAAGASGGAWAGPIGVITGVVIGAALGAIVGGVQYALGEEARKITAETVVDDATNKVIALYKQKGNEDMFTSERRFREVTAHLKLDETVTQVLLENAHELEAIAQEIKANTEANNMAAKAIAHTVLQDDTTYQSSRYKEGLVGVVGEEYQNLITEIYNIELADQSGDDDDVLLAQRYERMKVATGEWTEGTATQQGWGSTKTNIKYKTAEGTEFIEDEIDDERMRQEIAAYEASKRIGKEIDVAELERVFLTYEQKLGTNITDALQSFTLGEVGDLSSLTQSEINTLMSQDIGSILTESQAQVLGYTSLDELRTALQDAQRNLEISMNNSLKSMLPTARAVFDELDAKLTDFSVGQRKTITTMISDAFSRDGSEGAEAMAGFIEKNISADEFTTFAEEYNKIDWSKGTATSELLYNLKQAGVTIEMNEEELTAFEETMKKSANAAKNITARFNDIRKELTEIKKIGEDLEPGEIISDEEYTKLVKANHEFEHMFMMTADGWQFIGGDLKAAIAETQNNVANLNDLRNRYKSITSEANILEEQGIVEGNNMEILASTLASGKYNNVLAEAGVSQDYVKDLYAELKNEETRQEAEERLKTLQAQLTNIIEKAAEKGFSETNAETVWMSTLGMSAREADAARKQGLVADESASLYVEAITNAAVVQQGISEEVFDTYVNSMINMRTATQEEIDATRILAAEQIAFASELKQLQSGWTNAIIQFQSGDIFEQRKGLTALNQLFTNAFENADLSFTTDELKTFLEDDINTALMQLYLQGDETAIPRLVEVMQEAGFDIGSPDRLSKFLTDNISGIKAFSKDLTSYQEQVIAEFDQESARLANEYNRLISHTKKIDNLSTRLSISRDKLSQLQKMHDLEYFGYIQSLNQDLEEFTSQLSDEMRFSWDKLGITSSTLFTQDGGLNIEAFNSMINWYNANEEYLIGLNIDEGSKKAFIELKDSIIQLDEEIFNNEEEYNQALTERADLYTEIYSLQLDYINELLEAEQNYHDTMRQYDLYDDLDNRIKGYGSGIIDTLNNIAKELPALIGPDNDDTFDNLFESDPDKAREQAIVYYEAYISIAGQYYDQMNDLEDEYLDELSKRQDMYDQWITSLEAVNAAMEHQLEMIELLNGEDSFAEKSIIYGQQVETAIAKQAAAEQSMLEARAEYEDYIANHDIIDPSDEKYQAVAERYQSSIETWYSSVAESANKVQEKYLNDIEDAFAEFDRRMLGMTMDEADAEWDWISAQNERWLDNTNAAYAIRDLERNFNKAIDSKTSLAAQQKLNQLRKDELAALREKDKLTQYDFDRANKRLEIIKAEIALQEAQQSKNQMRLIRGADGVYSYQYVTDASAIEEATAELDKLNNELYNLDKEQYIKNLSDVKDMYKQMAEEAKAIMQDMSLSEEERAAKLQDIFNKYGPEIEAIGGKANEAWNYLGSTINHTGISLNNAYDALEKFSTTSISSLSNQFTAEGTETIAERVTAQLNEIAAQYKEHMAEVFGISEDGAVNKYEQTFQKAKEALEAMVKPIQGLGEGATKSATYLSALNTMWSEWTNTIAPSLTSYAEALQDLLTQDPDAKDSEVDPVQTIADRVKDIYDLLNKKDDNTSSKDTTPVLPDNWASLSHDEKIDYANSQMGHSNEEDQYWANQISATHIAKFEKRHSEEQIYNLRAEWLNMTPEEQREVLLQKGEAARNGNEFEAINLAWLQSLASDPIATGRKHLLETFKRMSEDEKYALIDWYNNSASYEPLTEGRVKKESLAVALDRVLRGWDIPDAIVKNWMNPTRFDTGGYTGSWGSDGRLAMLHEKELILNQDDTNNILRAVDLVRNLDASITQRLANYMNAIDNFFSTAQLELGTQDFEQHVHITAEFPYATDRNEIEEAFRELVNLATQRAFENKKI